MKKLKYILAAMIAIVLISSCGGKKGSAASDAEPIEVGKSEMDVQALPFLDTESKLWGLISPDGEIVLEPKWSDKPTVGVNDRVWLEDSTERYTLYNLKGEAIINNDSVVKCESVSAFYNGRAFVKPVGADLAIIDANGELIMNVNEIDGQKPEIISDINEGVGIYNMGKNFGVIDLNGRIILKAEYASVGPYKSGKLVACKENNFAHPDYTYDPETAPDSAYSVPSSTASVYDINGESIVTISSDTYPIIYDRFFGDYLPVAKKFGDSYGWGFIDAMGKEVLAPQENFKCFFDMRGEYYIYSNESGLAGMKKLDGTEIIKPEYSYLEFVSDKLIRAQSPDAMGLVLLNLEGATVKSDFASITPFFPTEFKYAAIETLSDGWSLIDAAGKTIDTGRKISDIYYTFGSSSVRASEPN